ncbi:hypothetical protein C7460_105193 [Marinoscillum furvescens DSM 4134]|uniref:Adhesin domain-containing protein n=2 Tax=Marinoscillum furvescens TaxID=1026 RepID=A0A3D9L653_MARFU|nr:hypothetical protein C7460_105193 [Marinoscillum furvescens DSM 4134]
MIILLCIPILANAQEQQENGSGRLSIDGKPVSIVVDNVFGSVNVLGSTANEVTYSVKKKLAADSKSALQKGWDEITMEVIKRNDSILFFLKAPYICSKWTGCSKGNNWDGGPEGYTFQFDVMLEVPSYADLHVSTVDRGSITIEKVSGELAAFHVNGEVTLRDAVEVTEARSVNGNVTVYYNSVPRSDGLFSSINGKLRVFTAEGLNARVAAKSMNGQFYTSFAHELIPPKLTKTVQKNGSKTSFRLDESYGIQIGKNGPLLNFETLNGDIFLRKL